MEVKLEKPVTRAEMEQYFSKMLESRLQKAMEEFVERNELRLKELSLIERIVRVEEELKAMREMFEVKFEAIDKRFEVVDKRFESVDKRFESMDKRFESLQREMNARFESLQREMNARFEAMDKRFSVIQWMIGIMVGIPAIIIAITQIVNL
jgi:flagellar capping protein FliD